MNVEKTLTEKQLQLITQAFALNLETSDGQFEQLTAFGTMDNQKRTSYLAAFKLLLDSIRSYEQKNQKRQGQNQNRPAHQT